ncbi:DUF3995 domain-containing protein [Micromonospora sp. DR5-3]|uniref:DUF3995 domain-containing protein n=1 Tax=unclassified Micromonospora TaxID=2617518 RepID=UPI001CA32791|nr:MULTISPECIES: DUF3995 domain-containing protein [unclassified Micromonospora]MCW3818052.1 DUF3995 domain-containing protein [Micromonospora sp. DR5-3]
MATDRTRIGGYAAAAGAAAYGSMKLAQALGANALADRDPLPPALRERLLARDPLFVASHWALAAAAVVGVLVALATVRPWGAAVPRRLLLAITWTLGGFMIARAVGVLGFGFVGDALLLAGVRPPPVEHAALARTLARWDLLLWSPFFLLWGTSWTIAARRLRKRSVTRSRWP